MEFLLQVCSEFLIALYKKQQMATGISTPATIKDQNKEKVLLIKRFRMNSVPGKRKLMAVNMSPSKPTRLV